jgi:hypothetical protein
VKRLLLLGAIVAALLAFAWSRRPRPLEFESTFEAALARARELDAWVVVHVRRADRPLGERMDRETLASREARGEGRDGFVHVRVDAAAQPELAERLAGSGGALATAVVDEKGELVALLPGFAEPKPFAAFLEEVREQRPAIAALRARLDADAGDVDARLDLARRLMQLGATARAELEVERARRDLDAAGEGGRFAALRPRALALHAELLTTRGQDAAAADLRRELEARYPAAPARPAGNAPGSGKKE